MPVIMANEQREPGGVNWMMRKVVSSGVRGSRGVLRTPAVT